jgi:hypothetical protein
MRCGGRTSSSFSVVRCYPRPWLMISPRVPARVTANLQTLFGSGESPCRSPPRSPCRSEASDRHGLLGGLRQGLSPDPKRVCRFAVTRAGTRGEIMSQGRG